MRSTAFICSIGVARSGELMRARRSLPGELTAFDEALAEGAELARGLVIREGQRDLFPAKQITQNNSAALDIQLLLQPAYLSAC